MSRYLKTLSISIVLLLGTLLPSLLNPAPAYGCSCAAQGGVTEKLSQSQAVFLGKAVSKDTLARKVDFGRLRGYTFEVQKVWKGSLGPKQLVYSIDGDSASCGFSFSQRQTYLIYANADQDGTLRTSLCSGNLKETQAQAEIAELNQLAQPAPPTPLPPKEQGPLTQIAIGLAAVIMIAAAALLVMRRLKGKP